MAFFTLDTAVVDDDSSRKNTYALTVTPALSGAGILWPLAQPPKVFCVWPYRCCKVRLRPQMRSARLFCGATPRFCGSSIGLVPMTRQRSAATR